MTPEDLKSKPMEMMAFPAELEWIESKAANRQEINRLLMDKLSDSLSEDQKESRIRNLLQEMRAENSIEVIGRGQKSIWILSKSKFRP